MSNSQGKVGFGRDAEEFLRRLDNIEDDRDGDGGACRSDHLVSDSGIHIISMSAVDGERVVVRVLVENEAGSERIEFSLLVGFVEELGLELGEISGEKIAAIEHYAEITKAYFSACSSFAFCEGSLKSLERKLIQKGFDRDSSHEAIDILSSRGLVNEVEIAKSRVYVFLKKKWGKIRILSKLFEEGFPHSVIESVREELDEVDFAELCVEHIRKKYREIPDDRLGRQKMCASLVRYGYSQSDIREAFKLIDQEK